MSFTCATTYRIIPVSSFGRVREERVKWLDWLRQICEGAAKTCKWDVVSDVRVLDVWLDRCGEGVAALELGFHTYESEQGRPFMHGDWMAEFLGADNHADGYCPAFEMAKKFRMCVEKEWCGDLSGAGRVVYMHDGHEVFGEFNGDPDGGEPEGWGQKKFKDVVGENFAETEIRLAALGQG